MAVHYGQALFGRIKRAGLRPVTIDIGGGICWQGGVTEEEQMSLLTIIQDLKKAHPEDDLPLKGEPHIVWLQRMNSKYQPETLTIPGMEDVPPEANGHTTAVIPPEPLPPAATAKPKRKRASKPAKKKR